MRRFRQPDPTAVARHIADAQRDAGWQAAAAAAVGDYAHSRKWRALAGELARLTRDAVELLADGRVDQRAHRG